MQYLSELTTQASGSTGGVTASHNQHARYLRARTKPTDPATPRQRRVRTAFRSLAFTWQHTLTDAMRESWQTYAKHVLLPNALGDPVQMTGRHHFFRAVMAKTLVTQPLLLQRWAPRIFDLSENTQPYFTRNVPLGQLLVNFTTTDGWVNEGQAFMLVYMAANQTKSVNFWKGPYRFVKSLEGHATFPPPSPQVVATTGLITPLTRWFFRTVTTRKDGRVTHGKRTFLDAVP